MASKWTNVVDHLGNEFNNADEMCAYYGISKKKLYALRDGGMSLDEILSSGKAKDGSIEVGRVYPVDHNGVEYASVTDMCKHYNIATTTLFKRLAKGIGLQEALTSSLKTKRGIKPIDHYGNRYKNVTAMCAEYGVGLSLFYKRIERGYTVEEALTTKVRYYHKSDTSRILDARMQ